MTEPIEMRESGTDWSPPDRPDSAPPQGPAVPPPPPPARITLPPGMLPPPSPQALPGSQVPSGSQRPYGPYGSRPTGGYAWPGPATARPPSGLFPSGPPRPTYREPHPARFGHAALGTVAGALWMALIGLLAGTARAYAWWTVAAGLAAWLSALALSRWGLRGIATGVAISTGVAVAIAAGVVIARWAGGHWVLW